MHTGSSSPFNKKESVIKEWPVWNQAITVSSFPFVWGQTTHCFKTGNILCNLFPGSSIHSDCHNSNIYLLARDITKIIVAYYLHYDLQLTTNKKRQMVGNHQRNISISGWTLLLCDYLLLCRSMHTATFMTLNQKMVTIKHYEINQ